VTSVVGSNELLVPVSKVSVLKMSQRAVDFDRYFGRPRQRWEDNIKMDLKEVDWEDVDQNGLNQSRDNWQAVMNTVRNLGVHKCREFCGLLRNWLLFKKDSAP